MGSTRLPGKSMMDLGGKPLIQHVLERAATARTLHAVVLATTQRPEDEVLKPVAERCHARFFQGSSADLIDRHLQAARAEHADIVVRIPGDNPLIHGSEVDRIVAYFQEHAVDFASNLQPRWNNGYPDGIGAEVFSADTLAWLDEHVTAENHREHVTTYFFEDADRFTTGSCECPEAYRRPEIKLDVNTARDLEYLRRLLRDTADCLQPLQMPDIVRWYDEVGRRLTRD